MCEVSTRLSTRRVRVLDESVKGSIQIQVRVRVRVRNRLKTRCGSASGRGSATTIVLGILWWSSSCFAATM